ncbi:MAG: M48 family metallopeptidase [Gammaproteobacteria bacterium]|nr:M48 family metallopeptidase [Gammaproteobacteria bacterium]
MKYTPKQAPEGINYSQENPLKELVLLLSTATMIIALVVYVLFVSSDILVRFIPFSVEQQLFQQHLVEKELGMDATQAWQDQEAYMQSLVERLQAANGDKSFTFKVHIIDIKTPNAFAFPGGHIGVTPELLNIIESENGLAMVLGHEMGHHYARDPIKGLGKAVLLSMVMYALTGLGNDEFLPSLVGQVSLLGMSRFSQDQERLADKTGKDLLMKVYGHAGGATEFFEKMKDLRDGKQSELSFFETHPPTDERIQSLGQSEHPALVPLPEFVRR